MVGPKLILLILAFSLPIQVGAQVPSKLTADTATASQICEAVKEGRKFPGALLNPKVMVGVGAIGIGFLGEYKTNLALAEEAAVKEGFAFYEGRAKSLATSLEDHRKKLVQSRIDVKAAEERFKPLEIKVEKVRIGKINVGGGDGIPNWEYRFYDKSGRLLPLSNTSMNNLAIGESFHEMKVTWLSESIPAHAKVGQGLSKFAARNATNYVNALRDRALARMTGFAGLALIAADVWDYGKDLYKQVTCSHEYVQKDPLAIYSSIRCMTDEVACREAMSSREMRQMALDGAEIAKLEKRRIIQAGYNPSDIEIPSQIFTAPGAVRVPSGPGAR